MMAFYKPAHPVTCKEPLDWVIVSPDGSEATVQHDQVTCNWTNVHRDGDFAVRAKENQTKFGREFKFDESDHVFVECRDEKKGEKWENTVTGLRPLESSKVCVSEMLNKDDCHSLKWTWILFSPLTLTHIDISFYDDSVMRMQNRSHNQTPGIVLS